MKIPAVHQLDIHPYLQQRSSSNGTATKASRTPTFLPLATATPSTPRKHGHGLKLLPYQPPTEHATMAQFGHEHGKSAAQVACAWETNSGRSVLAENVIDWQMVEKLDSDSEMDTEDMAIITTIDQKTRFNDPSSLFGARLYRGLDGYNDKRKDLMASEAVGKI